MRQTIINRMSWVGVAALITVALSWFVLPCWSFRPCSITIHSTFAELPELTNDHEFAEALTVVLHNYREHYFRIGNRVYVARELARDSELSSKYTLEAAHEVISKNPTYKLPVELIDRYGGQDFSKGSTNEITDIHSIVPGKKEQGTNSAFK